MNCALPLPPKPKPKYQDMVDQIVTAQGVWVEIDPTRIAGRSKQAKQTKVLQAGAARGLKFETTFRAKPFFFARLAQASLSPDIALIPMPPNLPPDLNRATAQAVSK